MCQSLRERLNFHTQRVPKISMEAKGNADTRKRKNNLTNSSKSPLIGTKQDGKNNTASGQKPPALCLCARCCHDSVFFVCAVSQPAPKGPARPGPPTYKSHNQWSFGKTDGKPRADRRVRGVHTPSTHQHLAAQTLRSAGSIPGTCCRGGREPEPTHRKQPCC